MGESVVRQSDRSGPPPAPPWPPDRLLGVTGPLLVIVHQGLGCGV
ncbi:hypothetical protein ACFZBU_42950 [Embleya sp. NPDC008237]